MADLTKPLVAKPVKKATALFKAEARPSWALLLNPLAWLLWTLDFLVWLLSIYGPYKTLSYYLQGPYSVEIDHAQALRHNAASPKVLTTSPVGEGMCTIPQLLAHVSKTHGELRAMGTRTYLGEHLPEGARFSLKKFGETKWITYAELNQRALAFGAALVSSKLGMVSLPPGADPEKVTTPSTILLFEDTCADWMTAALGATAYSLIVATSYATLGIESVAEAINESSVPVVLANRKQVAKVAALKSKCPSLRCIVYTELNISPAETAMGEPEVGKGAYFESSAQLFSFASVLEHGASLKTPVPPTSGESVAVIMYTSGSTGKPKGVVIKHESILASISGLQGVLGTVSAPGDCYLGYLPQAHILEFCAELTCLSLGVCIGYADPRSLSSTGAVRERPDGTINSKGVYPYPPGAIQEFRPAFMAGVPKIWDILKKAMEDQVGKMSPLKQMVFQIAFAGRAAALRQHREAPLLKKLVFSKLAQMLGGNLKTTVSGGGALSSEVQTFVRVAFCAPAVQGYALTETCCSATVQHMDDNNMDGVVGPPLTSVEMRLQSVDILDGEGKPYRATDTMHMGKPCRGRGEVQMRGPPISAGYFRQPEKSAEVFMADGWFCSGDVGVWRPDGQLAIVDRLKNLIKLKGGEYIAIEAMEKEYATCPYVSGVNGGLLCYGDSDMDRPVAFVVADEKKVSAWADQQGIQYDSWPALAASPEVNAELLASLVKAGKSGKLQTIEILAGVVVLAGVGPTDSQPPLFTDPWTPENGMLTASNKLQRNMIVKSYGAHGVFETLKDLGIK